MNKWKILFRGENIYLRDDTLNKETKITRLVGYLKEYSIWPTADKNYFNVPSEYYQAWKILVLGVNEYDDNIINIIESANRVFSQKGEKHERIS